MKSLFEATVRGYVPLTSGRDPPERKARLRDEILNRYSIDEKTRQSCRGRELSIDVCFFLNNKSGIRGAAEKDLDNLLKIFLDVLTVRMDNLTQNSKEGLGLIEDDSLVKEIRCRKSYVESDEEAGITFAIYDAGDVEVNLRCKQISHE